MEDTQMQTQTPSKPSTPPESDFYSSKTITVYLANRVTQTSGAEAELSWSFSRNRVRLTIKGTEGPALFSVPMEEIQKADFSLGRVILTVAGTRYALNMSAFSNSSNNLNGMDSIAMDMLTAAGSGVDDLRKSLLAHGVKATKPSFLRLIGISVLIVIALMVIGYFVILFNSHRIAAHGGKIIN